MLEPLPPFQPQCNLLRLSQCHREMSHFGIHRLTYRNMKRKRTAFYYTAYLHLKLCMRVEKLSLLSYERKTQKRARRDWGEGFSSLARMRHTLSLTGFFQPRSQGLFLGQGKRPGNEVGFLVFNSLLDFWDCSLEWLFDEEWTDK